MTDQSYREVLRDRRLAGLLLGDLPANIDTGRFALNGLLGVSTTFALYIVGPVLGEVIIASTSPGVALMPAAR